MRLRRALVHDLVNATMRAVPDGRIGIVTDLRVVEIGHVDGTVRPSAELDDAEVGIVGDQKIFAMAADVR